MKKLPLVFFIVISLLCISYTGVNKWSDNNWKTIIRSDGAGYYVYLPCIFIYHNFDYKSLEHFNGNLYACYSTKNGKLLNKYFIGLSVLLAPFFLLACFLSYLFGFSLDGFSLFFQLGVSIGGLFYLVVGLIFTRKLLLEFKIPDWVIYFTLTLILFGTNLFYYSTIEPSMSHVYSFALIAAFLYYTKKFAASPNMKYLSCMAIILGLTLLVRPTNIFCLALVPFITGSADGCKQFLRYLLRPKYIVIAILIPIIFIGLQLLMWHSETGRYLEWSYPDEKFYFARPHFWSMLFSYRKGLYIYAPIIFIATIGGLYTLLKKDIFRFFTFFLFFIPFTYALSCWWNWYFGDSYGMRVFIDFYAVFALLLAIFLSNLSSTPIFISLIAGILCIGLNFLQQYQYINNIMSHDSMSMGRYWNIFLRTGKNFEGIFYTHDIKDLDYYPGLVYTNDFENNTWGNNDNITADKAHTGKHSAFVNEQYIYSPTLILNASQLPIDENIYAHIDLWLYSEDTNSVALFVINSQSKDGSLNSFNSLPLKSTKTQPQWEHFVATLQFLPIKTPGDIVKIYIYCKRGKIYYDDLTIRLGHPQ